MPLEIVRDLRVGGALGGFQLPHALLVLCLGLLEKTGLLLFAVHQHLSGGGHDVQVLADKLAEKDLLDSTIVVGDFNFDLRAE